MTKKKEIIDSPVEGEVFPLETQETVAEELQPKVEKAEETKKKDFLKEKMKDTAFANSVLITHLKGIESKYPKEHNKRMLILYNDLTRDNYMDITCTEAQLREMYNACSEFWDEYRPGMNNIKKAEEFIKVLSANFDMSLSARPGVRIFKLC